jgi:predicted DNA-binding antitoxin AbrB/MazE fold protein
MTTIIEIAAIRPPKEGKKVATVVSDTGQSFEIWPDKAAKLTEGKRYEVEIEEREWNSRTIRKITKTKEVMQTERSVRERETPTERPHDTRPQPGATAGADQERDFVLRVLNAFIAAGQVKLDARELAQATTLLRMLWSSQFGDGLNTFRTSEAQRRN